MKFSDFGFKKFINDALKDINFHQPTSIQQKVIPIIKKNKNVVVQSHTGTGKTHAFLLPILNNLNDQITNKIQCLIITPTRELARQIYQNTKELLKYKKEYSVGLFIGGEDVEKSSENLKNKQPTIAIGTPTRLKKMYQNANLYLTTSSYVVIDECDMIFDLNFIEEVDFLLSKINNKTNISLFSATINNNLKPFLQKYLSNCVFIDNCENKVSNKNIVHNLIWTKNKENKEVLKILCQSINPYICIIFVNKKIEVSLVYQWLTEFNISCVGQLHGDLDARVRSNMQKRIQANEFKWIVATDVASRGIDIDGVSHIISLDLPKDLDFYIHRSGRTGRNNYTGYSYVLFNSNNQKQIDELRAKKIEFENYKLVNNQLVKVEVYKKNKKAISPFLNQETKKILSKYKLKKIKPNYKKKRKNEIEKIKKEVRKKHIKESIAKIKKVKYKKRRENLFDN